MDFCLPKPHFNSVNINKSLIMLNSWPIKKLWFSFDEDSRPWQVLKYLGCKALGHHGLMLVKQCLRTPAHRLCSGDFSPLQKHWRGFPGTLLTKLGYSAVHW